MRNRAERRLLAKQEITRTDPGGIRGTGEKVRDARNRFAKRVLEIEKQNAELDAEAARAASELEEENRRKALGLQVVRGKDVLWTPDKEKP